MDEKDRLLLTYLHNGLPLVERPFDVLAEKKIEEVVVLFTHYHHDHTQGLFLSPLTSSDSTTWCQNWQFTLDLLRA